MRWVVWEFSHLLPQFASFRPLVACQFVVAPVLTVGCTCSLVLRVVRGRESSQSVFLRGTTDEEEGLWVFGECLSRASWKGGRIACRLRDDRPLIRAKKERREGSTLGYVLNVTKRTSTNITMRPHFFHLVFWDFSWLAFSKCHHRLMLLFFRVGVIISEAFITQRIISHDAKQGEF